METRGYLEERWVRGRAAENGSLFYPSGFAIAPYFFEKWFKGSKNSSMYMKPIVEMDNTKIIEKLNQNKSAGNDDIGNYIIIKRE